MINYSEDERCYHIGVRPGEVGKYIILPGAPKRVVKIAKYFDNPVQVADNREYITISGTILGEKVSVCSTGIGGPSASIALEELSQCGGEVFIRDLVLAASAVRMEGTSKEYAPIEWPATADFFLTKELHDAAERLGFKNHVGVVQCKDAFYGQHKPEDLPVSRELLDKWRAWLKLGCKASEMESAALFTVGAYLKKKVGTVLFIVSNQERVRAGMSNPIYHDTDKAIQVAIEAIKEMIRKDRGYS